MTLSQNKASFRNEGMKTSLIFLIALLSFYRAYAHPVTYQGGTAYMSWNGPMMSDQWLSYSPTARFALTARAFTIRDMANPTIQRQFYFPQANFLLRRWNGDDYQGNVYLSGAWGLEKKDQGIVSAGLGAIEADWESRHYYVSGKYQLIGGGLDYTRVRAGMAPYLAPYDGLHTWAILQVEHQPDYFHHTQITPLLRFFKNNILWEVGSTLSGQWMFNFMVHF